LSQFTRSADRQTDGQNSHSYTASAFHAAGKTKTASQLFPHFTIDGHCLQFVNEFRYLEHKISNNLCDDADIKGEIHNMCLCAH